MASQKTGLIAITSDLNLRETKPSIYTEVLSMISLFYITMLPFRRKKVISQQRGTYITNGTLILKLLKSLLSFQEDSSYSLLGAPGPF